MSQLREYLTRRISLPTDADRSVLVGRVFRPGIGPSIVSIRNDDIVDITNRAPTITDVVNADDPVALANVAGKTIGDVETVLQNSSHAMRSASMPWFLAPIDLQPVKAAGVTFLTSLIDRVIEEKAGGSRQAASDIRGEIEKLVGTEVGKVRPGSIEAESLKAHLQSEGMWSQYLEVGIGPDAEVFTKCPPMAAVGTGSHVGILRSSHWNNPEPELAMLINDRAEIVGATLANDVNLRDIEGRSALLLGKAKDNNGSAAIGPLIRLLDATFSLRTLKSLDIGLRIDGVDGFSLSDHSSISLISRDLEDLVAQTIGPNHQYPDGLILLSGTMFAPNADRDAAGLGFRHNVADIVQISCPSLGTLVNQVEYCDSIEPWTFGLHALLSNLQNRAESNA